jgi:hypothetical protein
LTSRHIGLDNHPLGLTEMQSASRFISI